MGDELVGSVVGMYVASLHSNHVGGCDDVGADGEYGIEDDAISDGAEWYVAIVGKKEVGCGGAWGGKDNGVVFEAVEVGVFGRRGPLQIGDIGTCGEEEVGGFETR